MERHPIDSEALHADKIMGASSVIFTWPRIFDSVGDSSLQSASKSAGSEGSTQTASARDPDGTPSDAPTFDWSKANSNAESYLTGPTEAIVLDPHPPSPPSSSSFDDEKRSPHLSPLSPLPPHKKRTPLSLTPTTPQTRMLAVVGLSGLLVAALFTASQNSASSSAALKQMGTEETKRSLRWSSLSCQIGVEWLDSETHMQACVETASKKLLWQRLMLLLDNPIHSSLASLRSAVLPYTHFCSSAE